MSRPGPRPKPTALRVLEGNPSKRPLPANEPKPKPVAPRMPAWLDREGRAEWRRITPELERLGLLTVVDGSTLATYCMQYSLFVSAAKELKDYEAKHKTLLVTTINSAGGENQSPHPAIRVAREAAQLIRGFAQEFGLSPSARTRIQVPGQPDDEPSAMERLLQQNRRGS